MMKYLVISFLSIGVLCAAPVAYADEQGTERRVVPHRPEKPVDETSKVSRKIR